MEDNVTMLVDTHAHLEAVENLDEVLKHARGAGVAAIVTIGTSVQSSHQAIDIAEKYSSDDLKIFATVGLHPFDSKNEIETKGLGICVSEITDLATTSKKIIGIGEAGLDYYGVDEKREQTTDEEKVFQKKLLKEQIKISNSLKLPLVVHCRNAWDEIFNELDKGNLKEAVFHSFTGKVEDAKAAFTLGYFVSFSGIVTFKNAKGIQEAAKAVPLDKILLETDSPYLTPEPFRGQKNESANVRITGSFLSNLLNLSESDFFKKTSQNAQNAFKLW